MSNNITILYLMPSIGFSLMTLLCCFVLLYRQSKKVAKLTQQAQFFQQELQISNKCAIAMGKTLTALQQVHSVEPPEAENLASTSSISGFSHDNLQGRVDLAQSLCKDGASSAQMIAQLGLTKVEAELISAMNQSKLVSH